MVISLFLLKSYSLQTSHQTHHFMSLLKTTFIGLLNGIICKTGKPNLVIVRLLRDTLIRVKAIVNHGFPSKSENHIVNRELI